MRWRRGKAYSQDLRSRVLAAADEGIPVGRGATTFRVSVSYVSKVLSRRRDTGEIAARPQRCHLPPKLSALHEAIRAEAAARPDATLAELRRWLSEAHQVHASEGLMHATLLRPGLTLKKALRATEQDRPDVAAARADWRERQPGLVPGRLAFIDETWAKTNMTRLRGRAPRGQRLRAAMPHGHWKTSTFIAGLRSDGLVAPAVFDGAINGELFLAYVEQILVPTCAQVTSSSWTISARTRARACEPPSRRPAPSSSTCPPIAPTSTRVWMAPAWQGLCDGFGELVGCGHVFGVYVAA